MKQIYLPPFVDEAVEACLKANTYALDLETSSFNPIRGRITGFSVATDTEVVPSNCHYGCCKGRMIPKAWYFQFLPELGVSNEETAAVDPDCIPMLPTFKRFRGVFSDHSKQVVMHNGKFDLKFFARVNIGIKNDLIDTCVASWLIDENRSSHKLKDLAKTLLRHEMVKYEELGGLFSPPISRYGADDACQTLRLWRHFLPILREKKLEKIFHELECYIPRVLMDMELEGITMDIDLLEELRGQVEGELHEVEDECHRLAGRRFLVSSPQEVGLLLFRELKWKQRGEIRRTKKGSFSTDREVLERYEKDKPLAANILKYRELAKLDSTYLVPLADAAQRIDGRVRSNFNQIPHPRSGGGTVTGRLSSSKSEELGGTQLQNIPSRSETGKKVRNAFISAEGFDLVTYDYSQIELRFMAHFSQDQTLLDAYRKWDCVECGASGETTLSLHACPQCGIPDGHRKREKNCQLCDDADVPEDAPKHGFCLGLDIHQITADACGVVRYVGKIINFALLYGLGPGGLARHLKVSFARARKIRDAYFRKYHGIVLHNMNIQKEMMRTGKISTILKRFRNFPNCQGHHVDLRSREWRQGANAKIQGSAADLMKVGMRNVHRRLHLEGLDEDTKILLQVHDELTLETPEHRTERVKLLTRDELEGVFKISVPIIAEGGSAKSWGQAK